MFALLHPSKTSVYETRLMGICVVNKSWIAVLAGPKKYEIPPARAEVHQSAPIKGDRPCHITQTSRQTRTVDVWSVVQWDTQIWDWCVLGCRHDTHFPKLFSLARRQPRVAHINILQSICSFVSCWLCAAAVPGVGDWLPSTRARNHLSQRQSNLNFS